MARNDTVWGIDIGNTSLKALHCRASSEPGKIEAIGFDFIEHSKIMSQPGAEPAEILVETLREFLARNNTKGSRVAISISGQSTISRFLKLPPVDAKKVNDIIKYEAKQWLPFDLQDVVWDYQPLGRGLPASGIVLDTEVGMFAMKRDIALKTLGPYMANGIDIDCIQSSPLAIYNYAAYDQLNAEEIDVDNPPDQIIVLNVGTDATDVIVTNGVTIWTRSIPIGGNLFTKAMTKSLKLTFTKAEYLKRNPTSGDDPKAVIQAMRPVFNDMLSEVHRSLEYYSSLNRKAKFTKVLALGNALKLPGLQRFLGDNLSLEVIRPTLFNRLIGPEVIASPVFKENIGSFGVAYGLVTQLLGESSLSTNLMPKDVVMNRIIQEKKPWILAAAASVLLGLTISYAGATRALETVQRGEYGDAETKANAVDTKSGDLNSKAKASADEFAKTDNIGKNLTGSVEGRLIWLEFFKAINHALPVDDTPIPDDPAKRSEAISKQNRIYVTSVDTLKIEDAAPWWEKVKENNWYIPAPDELEEVKKASGTESGEGGDSATDNASSATPSSASGGEGMSKQRMELDTLPGPPAATPCRLVQLTGYHYHNDPNDTEMYAQNYLRETICRFIRTGAVQLPVSLERQIQSGKTDLEEVSFKDLGFMYPVVLFPGRPEPIIALDPKAVLEQENKFRMQMLQKNAGTMGGIGIGAGGIGGMSDSLGTMYSGGSSPLSAMGSGGMGASSSMGGSMGGIGSGMGGMRGSSMGGSYGGDYTGIGGGMTGGGLGLGQIASGLNDEQKIQLSVYNFVIQFIWIETPPSERDRIKEEILKAELEKKSMEESSDTATDGSEAESAENAIGVDDNLTADTPIAADTTATETPPVTPEENASAETTPEEPVPATP